MRKYSKRINLIQISNQKIEILNERLKKYGYNQVYTINTTDITPKYVTRLIEDLDSLIKEVSEDSILEAYLDARFKLDDLRMHLRAEEKQEQKQNS